MPSLDEMFPAATPVCVRQTVERRGESFSAEVVGTVESWERQPTGSWHVRGKNARLWLDRLVLRKADGELVLLVIDDSTEIARIESAPKPSGPQRSV